LLFLTPQSASFVPARPVWIKKIWIYFFDKPIIYYKPIILLKHLFVLIDFTPFSNFNLLIFRSGKSLSHSLCVPLKGERRAPVETKKKNHGWSGD
jgi:hypothetical protein